MLVCSRPALYQGYTWLRGGNKRRLALSGRTDIVIDGFPRSANTFAVVSFEQAQNQAGATHIAHHTHVPATIVEGCSRGLPVIVLIRDPVEACASLAVYGDQRPELVLADWIWFYQTCWSVRHGFVTVPFECAVSDFDAVISAVNRRWSKSYQLFGATDEKLAKVQESIERIACEHGNGEDQIARPSIARADKKRVAREVILADVGRLGVAMDIYESYIAVAREQGFKV